MEITPLSLQGLLLIKPKVFCDERGFFLESFQKERFIQAGLFADFVQDNHSCSQYGCIRGMHFQSHPGQAKLIRTSVGTIFDVAVDIRPDSPTFGKWEGVILDGEKHQQLFLPVGFAHGFCVLSEIAHVCYKVTTSYCPETEKGFRWDDPTVGIDWPVGDPIISERDQQSPLFGEVDFVKQQPVSSYS